MKKKSKTAKKAAKKIKRPAKKTAAKKPVKKKPVKVSKPKSKSKKPVRKAPAKPKMPGTLIGQVTHYFPHVEAAAVKITKGNLERGNKIRIKGHTTDFELIIASIQLDHSPIEKAKKGDEIGFQVPSRVREGDEVYKLLRRSHA